LFIVQVLLARGILFLKAVGLIALVPALSTSLGALNVA
jgi:hypothetical protein